MATELTEVRAAIVKAVPEILRLTTGCVLDLNGGESYGYMTIHQETNVCKKHKKYREECGAEEDGCTAEDAVFGTSGSDEGWWEHTVKMADIKPHQIVGRPIRLADVLRAIQEKDSDYSVSAWGGFEKWTSVPDKNDTFVLANHPAHRWNLTADSLDDQSPETIAFLYSILYPIV